MQITNEGKNIAAGMEAIARMLEVLERWRTADNVRLLAERLEILEQEAFELGAATARRGLGYNDVTGKFVLRNNSYEDWADRRLADRRVGFKAPK